MQFEHKIQLNRDYYIIGDEIYRWIRENIGFDYENKLWEGHHMFGYFNASFQKEEDLKRFKEWADKRVKEVQREYENLRNMDL